RQTVEQLDLSTHETERLLALLDLHGERDVLEKARKLVTSDKAQHMITNLEELAEILDDYGVSQHMSLDFTLVSHMDYYTGIVYEGYNGTLGFPLASGGRYDELLGAFD